MFDIKDFKSKYGLTAFVETGTWRGAAVEYARVSGFEKIYSIELHQDFWDKACKKFSEYPHIKILKGASIDVLPVVLPDIAPDKTLWWLDAHLHETYGVDKNLADSFPLEKELKNILATRDISGDVFIMDDLRIYEDGPFTSGFCPHQHQSPLRGIEFIYDLMGQTHLIEKRYDHEGYVVAIPNLPYAKGN
jgi:hypothetical protein